MEDDWVASLCEACYWLGTTVSNVKGSLLIAGYNPTPLGFFASPPAHPEAEDVLREELLVSLALAVRNVSKL